MRRERSPGLIYWVRMESDDVTPAVLARKATM
jgi:hypothetical protein